MRSSNTIASLLRGSPFKPMQAHMRVVLSCAQEVPGLFEALIAGDQAALTAAKECIFAKEQEADQIKNNLRAQLPRSLFMPVDRRDLLELQDSIANTAQDIAGLMMERDMTPPAEMVEPLRTFVQRCVDTCVHSGNIIEELDELLETGFRGRDAARVEVMVDELNRIEDETDEMGMALARILFSHEDQMKPVSVVFWYQMLHWIGDLADYAEKVGDRLRLLIAR